MKRLLRRLLSRFAGPTQAEIDAHLDRLRARLLQCEADLAEIKRTDPAAKIVRLPLRR